MKECTTCKETKPLTEFYNSKVYKGNKSYRCKSCDTQARRAYVDRQPDRFKAKNRKATLKYKYGLTVEDYDKMSKEQNHKCLICEQSDDSILVVDHCHTSGSIRGLLCRTCNQGLGLFKENIASLENAIKYLKG